MKTATQLLADISKDNKDIKPLINDISADIAEQAHRGTSHVPDVRGVQERVSYARALLSDFEDVQLRIERAISIGSTAKDGWQSMLDLWKVEHRSLMTSLTTSHLQAKSNCISAMIAGPAKFPTRRAEKASDSESRRYNELEQARERSKSKLIKSIFPHGTSGAVSSSDPEAMQKLYKIIDELERKQENMKAVNKVIKRHVKKLEGEDLKAALLDCHQELKADLLCSLSDENIAFIMQPSYSNTRGYERFELSNNLAKIKQKKLRIKELERTQSLTINDSFENGVTVSINEKSQIAINFGFKPDEQTRNSIKSKAFNWSRYTSCWVRKLTDNANYDYEKHVKPILGNATPC